MSIQKATGNMYPWVDYVHSYLRGACPYACPYCYVQAIAKRFNNQAMQGPLRFDEEQLKVDYNQEKYRGKIIFVEHTHDLFHPDVKSKDIFSIIEKIWGAPKSSYVFQTRNPMRIYKEFNLKGQLKNVMIGTTIETNRNISGTKMKDRAIGLFLMRGERSFPTGYVTFLTIEPILEFDLDDMIDLIDIAKPHFVNIGADSKGTGLEEPSREKVLALIAAIKGLGIEIRTKRNLERILRNDEPRARALQSLNKSLARMQGGSNTEEL